MKKFIRNLSLFFVIFGLIFIVGIFLPTTPASKNNMLSYKVQKDSLLRKVKEPRIVFVGGSNLVFGLNSGLLKNELKLNPVNAGMAINFGLIYMMDDILEYIKPGDIVVLAPEYQHYYGNNAYGGNDLFRLLMDTERSGFSKIRKRHIPNLIKAVPVYFLSKFSPSQYFYDGEKDVYGKHIFNAYGDSDFHWGMEQREFPLINPIRGQLNATVIDEMELFEKQVQGKGARLFVTFPGFQKSSYSIVKDQVDSIELELKNSSLKILGTPQRYLMEDSLMFDQIYHLTKEGADRRTHLLIEDMQNGGSNNDSLVIK